MPAETATPADVQATPQPPPVLAPQAAPTVQGLTDTHTVSERMEAWKPSVAAMEAQAIEAAKSSRLPKSFPPLPFHKRMWYRMLRWVNA